MFILARIVGATVLIAVAAFCVFGFLAAGEVPADANSFRLVYGAAGVVSVGTAVWLAWPRRWKARGPIG